MEDKNEPLSRRALLGAGVLAGAGALAGAQEVQAGTPVSSGVVKVFPAPDFEKDISDALQAAIDEAAAQGHILQLGAGNYACSGLSLPGGLVLHGVPGHTRLILSGDQALATASEATSLYLNDLIFDGRDLPLAEDVSALLKFSQCANLNLTGCSILKSAKSGVLLEQCSGCIADNHMDSISGVALLSYNASALRIEGNKISQCGDGGILVHRWSEGSDGTLIAHNHVAKIAARSGGTGQNGNGINVFRANDVTICGNKMSDCAFSAIRANAASNLQVLGNTCLRSGETALYVEFGFQGAVVSNNLIEGAANGISITNFNEGGRLAVCSGNLLRNIAGTGPYAENNPPFGVGIAVEADTSVTGNLVEGAGRIGINLGWGSHMRNLMACQNTIRATPVGIAISLAAENNSALISQNIIAGCTVNISGFLWEERASPDLAIFKGDLPHSILVTDNLVSPE